MYKNMNKETWKKVLYLGLTLLIIAGILVVLLRGFNVDLMLEQHDEITYQLDSEYSLKDIKSICKEVFGKKCVYVKEVELFGDAIQINVEAVTDEEKSSLVEKMNEKFETTKTVDDLEITTVSNVRIRDWVTPYVKPVCITIIILIAYMAIRFKKINPLKLIGNLIFKIAITMLALLSFVAIVRLPLMPCYITILIGIALVETVMFLAASEKKLMKANSENKKNKK